MKKLSFFENFLLLKHIKINQIIIYVISSLSAVFFDILGIGLLLPLLDSLIGNNNYSFLIKTFSNLNLTNKYDLNFISLLSIIILLIFFIRFILSIVIILIQSKINRDLKIFFSLKLFRIFCNQDLTFYKKNKLSNLIRDLTHETKLCANSIISLLNIISDCLLVFALSLFLFIVYPLLTLLVSSLIILSALAYFLISKKFINRSAIIRQKVVSKVMGNIKDLFYGFRDYLLNLGFKNIIKNYKDNFFTMEKQTQIVFIIQHIPRYYLEFMIVSFIVIVIFFQNINGIDNSTILTSVGIFMAAALKILPQVNRILNSYQQIIFNKPAADLLINYFDTYSLKDLNYKKTKFIDIKNLKINNLNFSYNDKKNLFYKDINLEFKSNDKILIVGKSGTGKSTLLDLIIGILKNQQGVIKINNELVDVIHNYKNTISYINKSSYLFNCSILENITLKKNIDKKDKILLKEIIEICSLNELKLSESGLNTIVYNDSLTVSSGQKQKIIVARALFKKASLIIFDEATNSIDTESEEKILKYLIKKKNVLFICVNHNSVNNYLFDKTINLNNIAESKNDN